ncbi:MAG: sarcosine oxidase subunit delta [Steroidobacteraceae bacterium]
MLRIPCPWCGPRDEIEFQWGGQAHIARPSGQPDDAQWAGYLHVRANPQGPHRERWLHVHGCRQWFNLVRDTRTHAILATYRLDEPSPDVPGTPEVPGTPDIPVTPAERR